MEGAEKNLARGSKDLHKIGVKSLYLLQSDQGFVLPLIQVSLFEQAMMANPEQG
jgi:hypothetical protein